MKGLLLALLILMPVVAVLAGYDEAWEAYLNQDYTSALEQLEPLAEQGDPRAQYAVGWMYRNGEGLDQDYETAAQWYRRAAEQGHSEARNSLGLMYQFGEGVAVDHQLAAQWYRLAAEQGHSEAQNNLGLMYIKGEGVTQSNTRAYMWLNSAASQGVSLAKWSQDQLERRMSAEQLEQAQAMAVNCQTSNYQDC